MVPVGHAFRVAQIHWNLTSLYMGHFLHKSPLLMALLRKKTYNFTSNLNIRMSSCRSFSAKRPLITGLSCWKWPIQIRPPVVLCHPVRRVPFNWSKKCLRSCFLLTGKWGVCHFIQHTYLLTCIHIQVAEAASEPAAEYTTEQCCIPQKSHIINGSFAERDVQLDLLKDSYAVSRVVLCVLYGVVREYWRLSNKWAELGLCEFVFFVHVYIS